MAISIVEQYWGGVARRLQAEVDVFNRLIGHAGEQGRENELTLARLLENLIPRRLDIGSGVIIDSSGRRSKQSDIVIYDPTDQPTVMSQANQILFPVEVVYAVIEVKTTLTAAELADCAKKKKSLSDLTPHGGRQVPHFSVLAYHAWATPSTVGHHLHKICKETRLDMLCVMSPGILAGDAVAHLGEGYRVGLAPLHRRDQDGARIPGDWQTLTNPPKGGSFAFEGAAYPVTRAPGNPFIVGEPGRALLLFCEALLRSLAFHRGLEEPVLSAYVDHVAREVIEIQDSLSETI